MQRRIAKRSQANVAATIRSLRDWGATQAVPSEAVANTSSTEWARMMAQARLLAAVPDGVLDEWLAAGNTLATILKKARRFAPVAPKRKRSGLAGFL